MTIKYEALVGHLFVVGGRSISSPPPGASIQPAPKRAHRSREQDTLFILLTPAGQTNATADFYEKLSKLATETYFNSRLGVTGALREAAAALNQFIQELNQRTAADYRAGSLMLVKRGDDIYIMRSGTTLCTARLNGVYTTFPTDPEMLNMLPLGSRSEPSVEFTHFALTPNDLFVLGDSSIAALPDEVLQAALTKGDIEGVLERLEKVIEKQAFAMVLQFVDADAPPSANETVPPTDTKIEPVEEKPVVAVEAQEIKDQEISEETPIEEPASPQPEPPKEISEKRQSLPQMLALGLLYVLSSVVKSISNGLSALLDRLLPEPEGAERQQLVPMNIVALVAVIIPALIGVVVVGFAISNRDTTVFEELRAEALNAQKEAEALQVDPNAAPKDKRDAWIEVRHWAERARRENPDSEEMARIILDSQNYIDNYDRILRVELIQLREFESNADLRGPIVAPNAQDIYVLDRNRSQVFRNQLDGSGLRLLDGATLPIVERGRPVNTRIVTNIIDIEWIDEGGGAASAGLIALDDAGLLISYHATFGLSAIELQLPPDWNRPEAMALWQGNFYVLDAGANQVWRFVAENGFYQNPPEEYFTGNNRPELAAAVDMGINDSGNVFILFNDGTISQFRGGLPERFELEQQSAPVDGIKNGEALFVSNDPRAYALYVADKGNAAIYPISMGGRVNLGYRPVNILDSTFSQLSGIYVDVQRNNVYVLAGNVLYRMPRELQ